MVRERRRGHCFRAKKCTKLVILGDKGVTESFLRQGKLGLKEKRLTSYNEGCNALESMGERMAPSIH